MLKVDQIQQGQAARPARVPVHHATQVISFGQQVPEKEVPVPETARDIREGRVEPAAERRELRPLLRGPERSDALGVFAEGSSWSGSFAVQRDEEVDALGQKGGPKASGGLGSPKPLLERPIREAHFADADRPRHSFGNDRLDSGRTQSLERPGLLLQLTPCRSDRNAQQPLLGHRRGQAGSDRGSLRAAGGSGRGERGFEQGRVLARAPAQHERALRQVLHGPPSRGASAVRPELLPHVPEDDLGPWVTPAADDRPRTKRPYAHLGCAREPAAHPHGEVRAVVRARCEADHGEVGLTSELGGGCDVDVRAGLDQLRPRIGEHRRQTLVDGAEASRVGRKHSGQPPMVEGS
jgi:hypothetical protein